MRRVVASLVVTGAEDLFQGGEAFAGFHQPVFQQRFHAVGAGDAPEFLRRFAFEGFLFHHAIHDEHFEDTAAATVAGVFAVAAALPFHERGIFHFFLGEGGSFYFAVVGRVRPFALGADHADKSLRHDGDDRAGHQERLDADIDKACDGAGSIVGVQGAEHQVTSERCLNGNFSGFGVTDLTHENNVRRLTEHGADDAGEVEADGVLHFHLIDSGEIVLDGIFSGDDFLVRLVHFVHGGIQGRGLAGSGGSGYQKDAVGALDDARETGVIAFAETEILDADHDVATVENTHDARLAVACGQHADAHVVMFFAEVHFDTAVLAAAFFGDVHAGHDFDTREQRQEQLAGRVFAFGENAIHAVANADTLGEWFYVDIAGAFIDGFVDDEVDEADDGGVGIVSVGEEAVTGFGHVHVVEFGEHLLNGVGVVVAIVFVNEFLYLVFASDSCNDFTIEDKLELGDEVVIGGIAHGDLEHVAIDFERNDEIVSGD